MIEPKPYPPTDSAEQEAVVILKTLLNVRLIKDDIRTRDKIPNIDGTLELVDNKQFPLGKLEIQIRPIGEGVTNYSCPTTLVAYSMVSTLPVLLICVDKSTKQAFWKHISPSIPEFKENQQSFTVHFSPESDSIDGSEIYIQKWLEIIKDYQERVAKFPILSKEATNILKLKEISKSDIAVFQQYIDIINNFLDNDFKVLKNLRYASFWKLGIGIVSSQPNHKVYQLYAIPYGEVTPVICKLPEGFSINKKRNPNTISEIHVTDFNPIEQGKDFIFNQFTEMVKQRALTIYGSSLAQDILIAFIDKYYRCLGLEPSLDYYLTKDVEYAMNQHLYQICLSTMLPIKLNANSMILLDLDSLSSVLSLTLLYSCLL